MDCCTVDAPVLKAMLHSWLSEGERAGSLSCRSPAAANVYMRVGQTTTKCHALVAKDCLGGGKRRVPQSRLLQHKPARALGTLVVSLLKFWVSRLNLLTKPTGLKTMFTFHQQPLPQETERTHGHEHTHGLNLI